MAGIWFEENIWMKYFVDDENWDVIGYAKELKKLLPRFNKETANF